MDTETKQRATAIACQCDNRLCTLPLTQLITLLEGILPIAVKCHELRSKSNSQTVHAQISADADNPIKYKIIRRQLTHLILRKGRFPIFPVGADEVAKIVINYATRMASEELAAYSASVSDVESEAALAAAWSDG